MSYSIRYTNILATAKNGSYMFSWPDELSESSRLYIENIIYNQNKIAVNINNENLRKQALEDNIYFLIFEEGAVVFCLRAYQDANNCETVLMGMYISKKYITTAWLMLNKVITFVKNYDFAIDSLAGEVYESDLDYVITKAERKMDSSIIKIDNSPYSFAIGLFDPKITNVEFYPCKYINSIAVNADCFTDETLSRVVESDCEFDEYLDEEYQKFLIERHNSQEKHSIRDIFKRKESHSLWDLRKTNIYGDDVKELDFLEDKKIIPFSRIREAIEL